MANKLNAKSIKKWISDNAIIVMILLAAIYASTQNKNFYSVNPFEQISEQHGQSLSLNSGRNGCAEAEEQHLHADRRKWSQT